MSSSLELIDVANFGELSNVLRYYISEVGRAMDFFNAATLNGLDSDGDYELDTENLSQCHKICRDLLADPELPHKHRRPFREVQYLKDALDALAALNLVFDETEEQKLFREMVKKDLEFAEPKEQDEAAAGIHTSNSAGIFFASTAASGDAAYPSTSFKQAPDNSSKLTEENSADETKDGGEENDKNE